MLLDSGHMPTLAGIPYINTVAKVALPLPSREHTPKVRLIFIRGNIESFSHSVLLYNEVRQEKLEVSSAHVAATLLSTLELPGSICKVSFKARDCHSCSAVAQCCTASVDKDFIF